MNTARPAQGVCIAAFVLVGSVVLWAAGCGRALPQGRLGHAYGLTHPLHQAAAALANDLRAQGIADLTLYPGASAGDERSMLEGLLIGSLDAAVLSSTALVGWASAAAALDQPFRFDCEEDAARFLNGPDVAAMLRPYEERGVVAMAWWWTGPRGWVSRQHALQRPEEAAGLRLAVQARDAARLLFPAAEVKICPVRYRADWLRDGMADAVELDPWTAVEFRVWEYACCFTETGHSVGSAAFLVRREWLDRLGMDQRGRFTQQIRAFAEREQQTIQDELGGQLDILRQNGVSVVAAERESYGDLTE